MRSDQGRPGGPRVPPTLDVRQLRVLRGRTLNFTKRLTDRLRFGAQLFARDLGPLGKLIKLEAHYMQGTAGLDPVLNDDRSISLLTRQWVVVLAKTTLTF